MSPDYHFIMLSVIRKVFFFCFICLFLSTELILKMHSMTIYHTNIEKCLKKTFIYPNNINSFHFKSFCSPYIHVRTFYIVGIIMYKQYGTCFLHLTLCYTYFPISSAPYNNNFSGFLILS